MRHWDGDLWKNWSRQMQEYLITSQSKSGHETGSWFCGGDGAECISASDGGRLYQTCLATMCLTIEDQKKIDLGPSNEKPSEDEAASRFNHAK